MPRTDFDGDGYDDILWRDRDSGLIGTWLAGQGGSFTGSTNSLVGVPSDWIIAATGDFNNDGNDDILWYNPTSLRLGTWLGQDDGSWVISPGLVSTGEVIILGAGDFDGRQGDDLAFIRTGPSGSFVDVLMGGTHDPEIFSPIIPDDYNFVGIGDFNGDGKDDLLWRTDDGTIVMQTAHPGFGISGRGFLGNGAASVNVPLEWQIVGIADFNGDGYADLLWRHSSGLIGDWLGGEGGLFSINNDSLIGVPLDWRVVATGDYDGDGKDDILWRHDSGVIGTWLGTLDGTFVINPQPLVMVSNNWLVQPNPSGAGEWDY